MPRGGASATTSILMQSVAPATRYTALRSQTTCSKVEPTQLARSRSSSSVSVNPFRSITVRDTTLINPARELHARIVGDVVGRGAVEDRAARGELERQRLAAGEGVVEQVLGAGLHKVRRSVRARDRFHDHPVVVAHRNVHRRAL